MKARKMQNPDEPDERRKAVQSLCDFVFDSRRVASQEFTSIVPILKDMCGDYDVKVRATVAKCLGSITATAAGRRAFDQHGFYDETLNLLKDEDEETRLLTNVALQRLVLSPTGADGLVEAGAIPRLIERVRKEPDNIIEILLHTLHVCCLIDPESALLAGGLEKVLPLLKNPYPYVRKRAATVVKDLTVAAAGRNKAIHLSAVPVLVNLCRDEDEEVQAKALAALMMISNATPGRFIGIEENAIEEILPLIDSSNPEIRLNAIKVLTALSEAPPGRELLLENLQKILIPLNDRFQEIRRAAKVLNAVVTFKP